MGIIKDGIVREAYRWIDGEIQDKRIAAIISYFVTLPT